MLARAPFPLVAPPPPGGDCLAAVTTNSHIVNRQQQGRMQRKQLGFLVTPATHVPVTCCAHDNALAAEGIQSGLLLYRAFATTVHICFSNPAAASARESRPVRALFPVTLKNQKKTHASASSLRNSVCAVDICTRESTSIQ